MYLRSCIVLFCLSGTLAVRMSAPPKPSAKIQQLKQESVTLAQTNQDTSTKCFAHFSPILDATTDQYENAIDTCNDAYESNTTAITDNWTEQRKKMTTIVCDSCSAVNNCGSIINSSQAFECAAQASNDNAKAFYALSADAKNASAIISEQYNAVATQRTICTSNAEQAWVDSTTNTYEDLNACLRDSYIIGPLPEPPTVPTLPTPTTAGTPTTEILITATPKPIQ